MQFSQEQSHHAYSIRAYQPGQVDIVIPISEMTERETSSRFESLTRSFIMTPNQLIRNWPPQHFDELSVEHFKILFELAPEVVLLGTGDKLVFPEMETMAGFMELRIGFEVMTTAAACRTYNILMNEGRQVAAAILQ